MAEIYVGRDTETKTFAVYGAVSGVADFTLGPTFGTIEAAEAHAKQVIALIREMVSQAQKPRALTLR